jgi:hypothetical protein
MQPADSSCQRVVCIDKPTAEALRAIVVAWGGKAEVVLDCGFGLPLLYVLSFDPWCRYVSRRRGGATQAVLIEVKGAINTGDASRV